MLTGRKLALSLAFTALVALATGVSCKGFFVQPTLQSIAVSPTTVNVGVGDQATLSVFGTYSDGSRSTVTSGVSWSVDPIGIVTIVGTGSATITGVTSGTTTITAEAQALSSTSSATVIGNVTNISVTPTSGNAQIGGAAVIFSFAATPGPPNFITTTNGGTLTITDAAGDSDVSCVASTDGSGNPDEECSATTGATGPYSLVMTYPGANGGTVTSPTATLTVSQ